MEIHASLLAADIFEQQAWITKMAQHTNAFHVDIIDPSFANFVGLDFRIIPKLVQAEHKFYIHYMAKWNDELIAQMAEHKPAGMFFHQYKIDNHEHFESLKTKTNIGIALELNEEAKIDVQTYVLMNVQLGYCGQKFSNENIAQSHALKQQGKTIISDGGITLETLEYVKHFDALVIGNALNITPIEKIREAIK